MKKSFLTLLVSILLVVTLTAVGCTTSRPTNSSTPTSSTSKESSLDVSSSSSAKPSSSSSLELINPSANSASSGVVIPSVNSNANSSASAVNPAVSGTSSNNSSSSSTQTSSSAWLPPIQDYDSNPTPNYGNGYNDSTKYNYSGVTYTAKQGGFTTSGTTYTTNAANTIAVNTSTPFPYGTISVDLTYVGGDSGIIFGYKNTGSNKWEGSGVSFYFLFINSKCSGSFN